jgi:hypothetical protein
VVSGSCFMLYGPRGAGKTTTALQLLQLAATKYRLRPLKVDFNSINVDSTLDAFWRSVSLKLCGEAEKHGIRMIPFYDVAGFVQALMPISLGASRVLLMLDEFDTLDHASKGIKEQVSEQFLRLDVERCARVTPHPLLLVLLPMASPQFLGAMRTIKQDQSSYGVQCIFAVGPFSIVFMHSESGSPFNVREAVPVHFFTLDQVSELFGQFYATKGISLDAGVVADVHEVTGGHAGLVCACGRALETGGGLRQNRHVTLAAWQNFRVRYLLDSVLGWPTIGAMADSVSRMSPSARQLLERALLAGDAPLQLKTAPACETQDARYLAAEGWLVAAGEIGSDSFRFTSPLVRSLALHQLAKARGWEMTVPLPFVVGTDSELNVPAALCAALPFFRCATMQNVAAVSSKISVAPAAITKLPSDGTQLVPNEAVYHFELFSVLRQWLGFWQHAEVYPEADVSRVAPETGTSETLRPRMAKRYCDLLVGPSSASDLKHILELVASTTAADIQVHYSRTSSYMESHNTNRGACITFTAVAVASAVCVPLTSLEWPSEHQLSSGLVAVHVVHDVGWTIAKVHWKSARGVGTAAVDLKSKRRH